MKIAQTALAGVLVVETTPFADHRGAFACLYDAHDLAPVIGARRIVQINHSRTAAVGTVRGMHFQNPPHAEMKLVRCLKGRVWDVAVDLRAGSPTFSEACAAPTLNEPATTAAAMAARRNVFIGIRDDVC